jgi:PAS domain S-box-containing protein
MVQLLTELAPLSLRKGNEAGDVPTPPGRERRLHGRRTMEDIRQIAAEKALRESEERFRVMAETVPDMLFTCRSDGECDFITPNFYRFTGMRPDEALGRGWLSRLHPEDFEASRRHWCECVRIGEPFSTEFRLQSRDRNYHWFICRASPIRDEHDTLIKWFGACTDVNDLKNANAALRESERKLKELNVELERRVEERTARLRESINELDHFSYSITHDLRAPLRAMQGFAKMVSDDCADCLRPRSMDLIRKIIGAAERMDKLIQDTLNYSKILRSEFSLRPVNPLEVLRGVLESYPQFASSAIRVAFEGKFPMVLADEAPLAQCFSNIIGNSLKFVAPGITPELKIWAEPDGKRVRLFFQDNGIGIPKEAHERIFGMFQRLDKRYEGTGIGLAIVRKAAERMGGQVGVDSQPQRGSRFWLELACPSNDSAHA